MVLADGGVVCIDEFVVNYVSVVVFIYLWHYPCQWFIDNKKIFFLLKKRPIFVNIQVSVVFVEKVIRAWSQLNVLSISICFSVNMVQHIVSFKLYIPINGFSK